MSHSNFHFEISERKILLRIIDVGWVLLVLAFTGNAFDFDFFRITEDNWNWTFVLIIYLMIFATVFELYDLQKCNKFSVVAQNIVLTASVTVLAYLLTPFYTPMLPANRMQIIIFLFAIIFALLSWRAVYIALFSAARFHKRILIIADSADVEEISLLLERTDPNYKIVAYVDTSDNPAIEIPFRQRTRVENMISAIGEERISEVVVATRQNGGITVEINNKLLHILERGISIRAYIHVYEDIMRRIPVNQVERDFYRYFPFSRSNNNKLYLFANRVMDIAAGLIGLSFGALFLPFLLVGNLMANRGPLFYHQTRVGKNGRDFKLYKLRSMITNAEVNGAQFAQKGDSRITKFGRILRKSRLDEIPQFYNVLRGDMSLIGPRPERPEFVSSLSLSIPFYEVRHVIKPGITGWAQVNAKYGECEDDALEKLQYDLYYIKHRGVFLDGSIILKTLSTIVFFRGQ